MATKTIHLLGTCKWAKLKTPDEEYGKYTLQLYPTEGSWETFHKYEMPTKIKEDEDGKFTQLSRYHQKTWNNEITTLGPPRVLKHNPETGEYEVFDGLIGNGSLVNCKVQVYDTKRGKGHTLEAVGVETLVVYNPDSSSEEFPF